MSDECKLEMYDGPPPFGVVVPSSHNIAIGHGAAKSLISGHYVVVIGNGRDVPEPIISNYVDLFGVIVVKDAPRLARALYKAIYYFCHRFPRLPFAVYRMLGPPPIEPIGRTPYEEG